MSPALPKSNESTATVSRKVNLPAGMVLLMFENEKMRQRWLSVPGMHVVKTDDRSLRMKLDDGTFLAITIHSKSSNKTQITLQQEGLSSAKAVQRQRTFWMEQLNKLEESIG
ncbi:MAG TPA: hypothetical protein VFP40_18705 [Terriglobales bacterium]|nr:hypothetical protein [Terriglobales bacterium]